MFKFFRKQNVFDDKKKQIFVDAISEMLEVQLVVAGNCGIEDAQGNINRKAIGYIYGFIDAALSTIGQDMSDISLGIPITFHVLKRLFPDRGEKYLQFLQDKIRTDKVVLFGSLTGGQQYIDYARSKLSAPMGLARFIIEGTN
jgi:hypothetical protein